MAKHTEDRAHLTRTRSELTELHDSLATQAQSQEAIRERLGRVIDRIPGEPDNAGVNDAPIQPDAHAHEPAQPTAQRGTLTPENLSEHAPGARKTRKGSRKGSKRKR